MSKASKSRSKEKRKKAKAARKAAQRAKYEGFKKSGTNQKSKRFLLNTKRENRINVVDHPLGPCGNVGCLQCNPPTGKTFPLGMKGYSLARRFNLMKQFENRKKS